jgi:hypothetical protein
VRTDLKKRSFKIATEIKNGLPRPGSPINSPWYMSTNVDDSP